MAEFPYPREFYRIPYPVAARPELVLEGRTYPVLDISEGGLRYDFGEEAPPALKTEVHGMLRFKQGNAEGVRGKVVRVVDTQAAIELSVSLPFKVILDEQRFLRLPLQQVKAR